KLGLTSAATTVAWGSNSCSNPSRFASKSLVKKLTPVTLPPGRLRLATRPNLTGSVPLANTIGIVVVAALAASAAGELVTMGRLRLRKRLEPAVLRPWPQLPRRCRSQRLLPPDGVPGRPLIPAIDRCHFAPSGIR